MEKMLGTNKQRAVGICVAIGTIGYFMDLKFTKRPFKESKIEGVQVDDIYRVPAGSQPAYLIPDAVLIPKFQKDLVHSPGIDGLHINQPQGFDHVPGSILILLEMGCSQVRLVCCGISIYLQ